MKIIREASGGFEARIEALAGASSLFDEGIEVRTREVIEAVAARGDAAVLEFTARFDKAELAVEDLRVSLAEVVSGCFDVSPEMRSAIELAHANIRAFSRRGRRKGWVMRNAQGGEVGEKFDPLERVGIYIPGGTAPLVSTVLMTVTLAKVAGCKEIVVCTPCNAAGGVKGSLLHAAQVAGATEIYRIGGAQAIAAMALGTPTVKRVSKIFGPGNAYVVAAKRLLFGRVGIDLLPGPSELLVLADETADPVLVAADMLAQAEHGSGAERVWLVTTSGELIGRVQAELARQQALLPRAEFTKRALEFGALIQVKSMESGVRVVNRLAPEHCELMVRGAGGLVDEIRTAGAIFVGPYSPTVLGDYVAGPSHTLPTGGAGQCFGGLTVDQFQRRTSVVRYDRGALKKSLMAIDQFAGMEGLVAHGRSASIRFRGTGTVAKRRGGK